MMSLKAGCALRLRRTVSLVVEAAAVVVGGVERRCGVLSPRDAAVAESVVERRTMLLCMSLVVSFRGYCVATLSRSRSIRKPFAPASERHKQMLRSVAQSNADERYFAKKRLKIQ